MRQKISTILDDNLYRRAKLEAVRQGTPISEILTQALETYLNGQGTPQGVGGIVAASRGALKIKARDLRRILSEEPDLFET